MPHEIIESLSSCFHIFIKKCFFKTQKGIKRYELKRFRNDQLKIPRKKRKEAEEFE